MNEIAGDIVWGDDYIPNDNSIYNEEQTALFSKYGEYATNYKITLKQNSDESWY